MAAKEPATLWLESSEVERVDAMIPALLQQQIQDRNSRTPRASRSAVLRQAVLRGLDLLERDLGAQPRKAKR
jgi:hypothetical protein